MKLLPRRGKDDYNATARLAESDVPETSDVVPGKKNRPTPKQRDQVGPRGPVTAPKTRKEAYARQKQQAKTTRSATSSAAAGAKMTPAERRAAMRSGDPAFLQRRDQGPTRKLARDYVDSHRMLGNYLLIVFVLLLLGSVIQLLEIVALVAFLVIAGEAYWNGTKIRKMATERNGSAEGSPVALAWYCLQRAFMPRRWRMPAPQVQIGDTI